MKLDGFRLIYPILTENIIYISVQ